MIPNAWGQTRSCFKTPVTPVDEPSYEYTKISDVIYGQGAIQGGEKDLIMDIYRADDSSLPKQLPLMIMMHSGGFRGGTRKSIVQNWSIYFAQKGYVVANIDYRIFPDNPIFSEQMQSIYDWFFTAEVFSLYTDRLDAAVSAFEDALQAYEYLKDLDYVDPDTVIMNGFSAGAVISEWIGYGVEAFGISSPPVKAVVSVAGLLTYAVDEMSTWIGLDSPPVFLVHNANDRVVPYGSTNLLMNRFEELNKPRALHCEETKAHLIDVMAVDHQQGMKIIQAQYAWLKQILSETSTSTFSPTKNPTPTVASEDTSLKFITPYGKKRSRGVVIGSK